LQPVTDNQEQSLRAEWIQVGQSGVTTDWRPSYHFSQATRLDRLGAAWPRLGDQASCLDGWRVSTNPASVAYDQRVGTAPVYRLRHVGAMWLDTDAGHWRPPAVSGEPFCVQPYDVLVRTVGRVQAALVGDLHRHHPADANLGIIRGLPPRQAVWMSYCLNQPLYRGYLESSEAVTTLVRVGLKRIASVPLAPMPAAFTDLAQDYLSALHEHCQALERLYRLRREVADWLRDEGLPDWRRRLPQARQGPRWAWFPASDLLPELNIPATEQHRFARGLLRRRSGVPLAELARVSPRSPRAADQSDCAALRIGDVDAHLGIAGQLPRREQIAWRTQRRRIDELDVLISTIADDGRVALIADPVRDCILPSEQLITLCFHRHPGAYALLLESAPVQAQWSRLAMGAVQRFVHPAAVERLVLPRLDAERGGDWHRRVVELLRRRRSARRRMLAAQADLQAPYRAVHPGEQSPAARMVAMTPVYWQ
jgi:hypothetical protein